MLLICLMANKVLYAEEISDERYDSLAYLFMQDDLLREDDSIVRKRMQVRRMQFAAIPYEALVRYSINKSQNHSSGINNILVIVEKNLYNGIARYIHRYAHDIHNAYGCGVKVYSLQGGTCWQLKQLILSNKSSLNGVVLIGDIIQANYRIEQNYAAGNHWRTSTFPCDLYYMDLDGNWYDYDNDGNFDEHTNHVQPEIFVGRIPTNHLHDPNSDLKLFFDRDHAYWIGDKVVNQQYGLTFTAPDWDKKEFWESLSPLYGKNNYDVVKAASFNKAYYIDCLANSRYEFIQLACHSNPAQHSFYEAGGVLYKSEIMYINKQALGYNLFCCSACDWSQDDFCLGQCYLLRGDGQTLALVGSTKTGSMCGFDDFYTPLGAGKCIGEAYKSWWINHCKTIHSKREKDWFYGMCILGDPLINFRYVSTCQDELTLNGIETNNEEYRAQNKIVVQNYQMPPGKHVSLCAPEIEIQGPFICTENAVFTTEEQGCIDRVSVSAKKSKERIIEKEEMGEQSAERIADCWIYPNPAHKYINVVLQEDIDCVRIFTISGQFVSQSRGTTIDISLLDAGIYVVHCITLSGQIYQRTFIKN
ncbi:MAG: T9SS type A sorting domain-containing protein [Bacteroides sp.]|nr:T9SS type A sorting domain-containing protein [Bacteroides sp.]MCM1576109.1 T9SS type A sorting domain-containing protein [Bacteroides sp.]